MPIQTAVNDSAVLFFGYIRHMRRSADFTQQSVTAMTSLALLNDSAPTRALAKPEPVEAVALA